MYALSVGAERWSTMRRLGGPHSRLERQKTTRIRVSARGKTHSGARTTGTTKPTATRDRQRCLLANQLLNHRSDIDVSSNDQVVMVVKTTYRPNSELEQRHAGLNTSRRISTIRIPSYSPLHYELLVTSTRGVQPSLRRASVQRHESAPQAQPLRGCVRLERVPFNLKVSTTSALDTDEPTRSHAARRAMRKPTRVRLLQIFQPDWRWHGTAKPSFSLRRVATLTPFYRAHRARRRHDVSCSTRSLSISSLCHQPLNGVARASLGILRICPVPIVWLRAKARRQRTRAKFWLLPAT
jgi:hypothetical protein